jgi:hypothetical protein
MSPERPELSDRRLDLETEVASILARLRFTQPRQRRRHLADWPSTGLLET